MQNQRKEYSVRLASIVGVAVVSGLLMGGCASQLLSDERLRENTAGIVGVPASEITVSERKELVPNTYYTATTKGGRVYTCMVNGGGVLAAGMVNPPSCSPKGQPLRDTNPLASR
jgi:hypothetical protein